MFARFHSVFFLSGFLSALILNTVPATSDESIHPESQIIILNNFVSNDESNTLIQFYNAEKKNLSDSSDNQLAVSSISNPQIRNLISTITNRVLQVMKQSYPLMGKNYHTDHGGIYARIPYNYCGYHADNVAFECPIHGKNQAQLRMTCPGNCPGARYVPNHTAWREYTALIYLNDAFEGGEILFEDGPSNRIYKKLIPIQSNMLVLTPNGKNFYHEVYPIRKGKRYSLHLWFTSDPRH